MLLLISLSDNVMSMTLDQTHRRIGSPHKHNNTLPTNNHSIQINAFTD